jgi:peptidoglycan/LPS O-acetylase OafA/YrhL
MQRSFNPVIEGLRGYSIALVLLFHLWQITWLSINFGLFGFEVPLDMFHVTGFVGVEIFMFIGGYCLTRSVFDDGKLRRGMWREFFVRRFAKIFPSYLLCIVAVMLYQVLLREGDPADKWTFIRHLFFVHNFFVSDAGAINGVLWSLAVEIQFYLLFPLLALWMSRFGMKLVVAMILVGVSYRLIGMNFATNFQIHELNQLPGFFDLYAFGMLMGLNDTKASKASRHSFQSIWAWAGFVGLILLIWSAYTTRYAPGHTIWQSYARLPMGICLCLLVSGASHAGRIFTAVFENRLVRYFARISYNLYLWHALILQGLLWCMYPLVGQEAMRNSKAEQVIFSIVAIIVCVLVGQILTRWVEDPARVWLNSRALRRTNDSTRTSK